MMSAYNIMFKFYMSYTHTILVILKGVKFNLVRLAYKYNRAQAWKKGVNGAQAGIV